MRDHPCSLMLFAAGFGTRMGILTRDRPKPLIEVAGKPLIDHALDLAEDFGAAPIVVNLHYKADMLAQHLVPRNVTLSFETPDILDTGGGLKSALPHLGDGPHFTMNTDAVWRGPNPLACLADAWRGEEMDALLLCLSPDSAIGHAGHGDFVPDAHGRMSRGPGLVYSGVQIIRPDRLHEIGDTAFSLNLIWDRMMQDGRLYGIPYPGHWCDVGHPSGIALAEAMLEDGDV